MSAVQNLSGGAKGVVLTERWLPTMPFKTCCTLVFPHPQAVWTKALDKQSNGVT